MVKHFLELWTSISTNYFSLVGVVSTIAWMADLAPKFKGYLTMRAHPAILRHGFAVLALCMFATAAFNAYDKKASDYDDLKKHLDDIESSADGSFASTSSSVNNAGDPWKAYISLHNYSLNRAIQFDVVSASVSVNGIKFAVNSKPSPPIPPSSDATFGMGEFPASALSSDGKANILRFEFRAKYGFVGFEKKFKYCRTTECELPSTDLSKSCSVIVCDETQGANP